MSEALERLLLQRFIGEVSYMRFVSTLPCLIIEVVTKCYSKGLELMQAFTGRLLENGEQNDLIARNQIKSFKSHVCSKVIAKDNKTATIRANRGIIGSLLSFSAKNNKPTDWENALSYPLSPIPLCLSTADGKPRKTAKSKLQEVVLNESNSAIVDNPREVIAESRHNSTYIVDLMAALRSVMQIPEDYEELTWKLLSSFPKGFQRVNTVADT